MSNLEELSRRRRKFVSLYRNGDIGASFAAMDKIMALHRRENYIYTQDFIVDSYNMATMHYELEQFDAASVRYKQCIALLERNKCHAIPLSECYIGLGASYASMPDPDKARAIESFDRAIKYAEPDSPELENAIYCLGSVYYIFDEPMTALSCFAQLTKPRHMDDLGRADVFGQMALCYEIMDDRENACASWLKSLRIIRASMGEANDEFLAMSYHLAQYMAVGRDYAGALKQYEACARIIRRLNSGGNACYTDTVNRIADMHALLGQTDKSLFYRLKALRLMKAQIGENHVYYANNLKNAALIYHEIEDYAKAISCLSKTLDIKRGILGPHSLDCLRDSLMLASYYLENSQNDRAADMLYGLSSLPPADDGPSDWLRMEFERLSALVRGTSDENARQILMHSIKRLDNRVLKEYDV